MKRVFISVIFMLIFISHGFSATTGKIAGTVTDASSGDPLPGVNVTVQGTSMGAATDVEGEYFIINVPPGTYNLVASMIGYTKVTKTEVRVKIDLTTRIDFQLKQEVVAGEEVTVVAERPIVEVDLTASKEIMSSDDITNSFVSNLEEAVELQQGVNYNGGIRGGFGLDVAYYVDGMEMRESGLNSNYSNVNTTAIQEMELLTGGFNAEFGRASGAIVNVVTKSARDRIHGSIKARYRPAGIYHWGGHMYRGNHLFENAVMGNIPDYWNYTTQNEGSMFADWSPQQLMSYWNDRIMHHPIIIQAADYDKRSQYELEGTLYGPLTEKLGYMISGRFKRGAPKWPSLMKYNPEWHGEVNLDYQFNQDMKLSVKVFHGGFDNSERARTLYQTSEDMRWGWQQMGAYLPDALHRYKYHLTNNIHHRFLRNPEFLRTWGGRIKYTHTFSPSTFLEAKINHFQFWRNSTMALVEDGKYLLSARYQITNDPKWEYGSDKWVHRSIGSLWPRTVGVPFSAINTSGNDITKDYAYTVNNSINLDLTSQMTDVHQVKAGLYFSSQPFNKYHHEGWAKVGRLNDVLPQEFTPWEGAAYIQDKIETKGMIINLGLRIDAFNGNAWVSDDPFDPLRIDEETPGNIGQNMVSVGDPVTYQGISESDEGVVKTSTKFALSPRIGISHPITENTVFHFMYGHFNQRSGWHKILSHPYWMFRPWPIQLYPETHSAHMIPFTQEYLDDQGVTKRYQGSIGPGGNPDLTFERMIQYEVGFDQNIADLLRVDVTMYYRDGQNLTSAGFREQRDLSYNTRGQTSVRLLADYDRLGAGTGDVRMWINGQFLDSRGIEFSLETQFRRFFNLRFLYDMSYTKTGAYGPNTIYRVFPDGRKAGNQEDSYFGGSNTDRGNNINNNQFWNPNNNFKLVGNFFTPRTFGPELSSFYPLGDWNLNFQVRWVQGRQYTYHSVLQGDFSTEPNNRRWEDLWNTNMSIRKGFQLSGNVRANLFVDVINLFDQNQLQLPSGSWREEYHENGVLPYTILGEGTPYETQYDNEWTWYVINQLPREVFFGIGLEF